MAKVYISYNHRDADLAKAVANRLRESGHQITVDVDSLMPGDDWRSVLMDGLQQSDGLVVLLTEHSIGSQYVLTEIGAARAFIKGASGMFLIPVVFGSIDIPSVIADLNVLRADPSQLDDVAAKLSLAISRFMGKKAAEAQEHASARKQIERRSEDYVELALKALSERERRNRWTAHVWYLLGYLALVGGVAFALYSLATLPEAPGWTLLALLCLKSVIIISLLIASAKYTFTLGKAHMDEALKNSNRIHAISFGKFYLSAFGQKASWAELKEVFQHWNIDASTSFGTMDPQAFDPQLLRSIVEVTNALASLKDKK